jgi:hypothetical protein
MLSPDQHRSTTVRRILITLAAAALVLGLAPHDPAASASTRRGRRRTHPAACTGREATGVTLPEGAGEDCHEGYHAAVLVLRSRTNDQNRFRTVHAENRGYGFERNLLGIRTEGLVLSTVAVTALATGTIITSLTDTQLNLSSLIIALVIAAAFVLFWARWPKPHRVRRAGDRYAQRLVDAASELS